MNGDLETAKAIDRAFVASNRATDLAQHLRTLIEASMKLVDTVELSERHRWVYARKLARVANRANEALHWHGF